PKDDGFGCCSLSSPDNFVGAWSLRLRHAGPAAREENLSLSCVEVCADWDPAKMVEVPTVGPQNRPYRPDQADEKYDGDQNPLHNVRFAWGLYPTAKDQGNHRWPRTSLYLRGLERIVPMTS